MIQGITGFIAGCVHVLSGPDHLAAVAPLSVESGRSSWKMGLHWGLGHSGGVLVVGMMALAGRTVIPVELISQWSERIVGVILLGIGLWGIRKALKLRIHTHEHPHGGEQHVHIHVHKTDTNHSHSRAHDHTHTAFGVGIIHGLAGSSHFLGVLPALALPTLSDSVVYLAGFGIGTIAAMVLFSSLIGIFISSLAGRISAAYRNMLLSFSSAAVGVGIFWLFLH